MARVKITEYRAKKLLLGDSYTGFQLKGGDTFEHEGTWVVKVDQGIKKRFKQGLAAVDVSAKEVIAKIKEWEKKEFSQFIVEPMFAHDVSDEQYISFELVRDGIRILYCKDGGVDIESHPELVQKIVVSDSSGLTQFAAQNQLPLQALQHVMDVFQQYHVCFLEINPLIVRDGVFHFLDAACLVDSCAEFFVPPASGGGWGESDIVKAKAKHQSEARVEAVASTTPAALKLNVLNPDGPLFFLLSGGGGSIVIADEAAARGVSHLIGNYGEYSGGPTREETFLYAKEIVRLMLDSKAEYKALVIAGGVANFTDIKSTFAGIIDALQEVAEEMRKQRIKVFVRRGGPNEKSGLAMMKQFLEEQGLFGSVHGSGAVITAAVRDAIEHIK